VTTISHTHKCKNNKSRTSSVTADDKSIFVHFNESSTIEGYIASESGLGGGELIEFRCGKCGRKGSNKKVAYMAFGNVLVVNIARYSFVNGRSARPNTAMAISETGGPGQMQIKLHDGERVKFELSAFVMHYGTRPTNGHYTACVKNNDALGTWSLCDDKKIGKIPAEQALKYAQSCGAYQLFFKRKI
jgi:ubiquitin C-terminal hydrolase